MHPPVVPAAMLSLEPLTAAAKRAALGGGLGTGAGASPLLACWRRSMALGADPDGRCALEGAIVSERVLADARSRAELLRRSTRSVVDGFVAACAANDFLAVLTDADGVVLDTLGGGGFADEARRLRLVPGAHWAEEVRGTNAIGTALAEGRPVAVLGGAHYARVNEGLVCLAAPIRDPRGELIGVLDATSFAGRGGALDPGVVVTVARAVEEVLRAREYARGGGGLDLVERLIERARDAAFLVERPGRIVRANAAGRRLAERAGAATLPGWDVLVACAAGGGARATQRLGGLELDLVAEPILDARGDLLALLVLLEERRDAALGGGGSDGVRTTAPAAIRPPPRRPAPGDPFAAIVGSDAALAAARELSARLARTGLPLLFLAETGTGKDLFARAVHGASDRSAGPFVAVNCGALQSELVLAELFGHGPGAFTGAARQGREGLIAAAHGGTLFLDEVADLSLDAQVALLRVLGDGSYMRVGETEVRRADVRVLAATSQDLAARVASGRFREDLLFRIGGARIELPPLRERRDLDELVRHLWARLHGRSLAAAPALSGPVLGALAAHRWPGNVRELESALEFAAALAEGAPVVTAAHLPAPLQERAMLAADEGGVPARAPGGLGAAQRAALHAALRDAGGNVSEAARALGVARSTVYRMAQRLGLEGAADAGRRRAGRDGT